MKNTINLNIDEAVNGWIVTLIPEEGPVYREICETRLDAEKIKLRLMEIEIKKIKDKLAIFQMEVI